MKTSTRYIKFIIKNNYLFNPTNLRSNLDVTNLDLDSPIPNVGS